MPAGTRWIFRNAIIVMTSNIGAEEIRRQASLGFALQHDEKRAAASRASSEESPGGDALRTPWRML